jgi:hypothetical protein
VVNPAINTLIAIPLTIFSEREIRVSALRRGAAGSILVERDPGAIAAAPLDEILPFRLIRSSSAAGVAQARQ